MRCEPHRAFTLAVLKWNEARLLSVQGNEHTPCIFVFRETRGKDTPVISPFHRLGWKRRRLWIKAETLADDTLLRDPLVTCGWWTAAEFVAGRPQNRTDDESVMEKSGFVPTFGTCTTSSLSGNPITAKTCVISLDRPLAARAAFLRLSAREVPIPCQW